MTLGDALIGEVVISLPWGHKAVVTPTIGTRFIDSKKALLMKTLLHGNQLDGASTVRKRVFAKESDFKTLARLMRQHEHGGTLLVVPNNENWRGSVQTDRFCFECYPYERGRTALGDREKAVRRREREEEQAEKEGGILVFFDEAGEWLVQRPLRDIGQLTAADGATLVTYDLVLLGFGAKIKDAGNKLREVLVSEPFEDSKKERLGLGRIGGTRHQSAAAFVFDQRDAIAIVASQDGIVSFFAWDEAENRVTVTRHCRVRFVRGCQQLEGRLVFQCSPTTTITTTVTSRRGCLRRPHPSDADRICPGEVLQAALRW